MKRFLAFLITMCIIFSMAGSAVVFAEDNGGGETVAPGGDETVVPGGDTSPTDTDPTEPHEHKPLDDTADQIVYVDPDEITVEVKKELLNSAELHPMTTGYEPLDNLVASIHSRILTPTMDTYEKVCTIYKYLMTDTYYEYGNRTAIDTFNKLIKTHNYKSKLDYIAVYNAYGMLVENYGVCNHYSSAFMVMTRALGLESYLATCSSSTVGLGGHYSAMIRLKGHLYRFDPVMGVVTDKADIVDDSVFFCTPMVSQVTSEFSFLEEQVAAFGNFEMYSYAGSLKKGHPQGRTEGDVRYSFGSYPQSLVTDEELVGQLNQQLDGVTMNAYPYTCGNNEPGSAELCDYMYWADITYNNVKYRAVRIDEYRPKYIHRDHDKENAQQSRTGYITGNTYWFKFEPIEWRLADGSNLLIADLVLDSQPFNETLYYTDKGRKANGRTYYVFNDEELTQPANDWEYSSIRRWLNEDFFNTAFTSEEQSMILDSEIKENFSYLNCYEYSDTTDKVFLLSYSEALDSDYFVAANNSSRQVECTDYAKSQGATSKRLDAVYGYSSTWLLRTPGIHSGDVAVICNRGVAHENVSAGATNAGIMPAIRVEPLSELRDDLTEAPLKPRAFATDTGQITLKAPAVNGVDGYKFYIYTDDPDVPEIVYSSSGPIITAKDLIPGKTYRFRSSVYRLTDGGYEESPLSESTELMCRTLVKAPTNITAEPVATGTIRLSFAPVEGATEYRVYRYLDSDTIEICATSSEPVIDVTGLRVGSPYLFKVTSVSDDDYESRYSAGIVSCMCESFPKRPENVKVEPYATHKLQISWDAVEGAVSYNVYRYYASDDIEFIRSTEDTSIIVSDLTTNSSYYYKVEAIGENPEDVSALSALTGTTCLSIPPVPRGLKVDPVATRKLRITWGAVEGAATYNVYRYFTAQGLVLLGSTDEPSYTVSGLVTGDNCFFRVEAVSEDGKDISEFSALAGGVCESVPPIPANVQVQPCATGSLRVSWDAVEGAATYNVYRYFAAADLKLLGNTSDTSMVVSGFKTGDNCFFKIEAVSEDGNDLSEFSPLAGGVCESVPPVPQNVRVLPSGTGRLTVSWEPSPGADVYNVYRYYSSTKSELLGSTSETSYEMSGLRTGDRIFFQIEAATADGTSISSLSTLESGVCESVPPIPQNVVYEPVATGIVKLSWDPSEGAAKYNIYRYYNPSKMTLLGTTEETEFVVGDLVPSSNVFFKIEAVSQDGEDISELTPMISAFVRSIPERPLNVAAYASSTGCLTVTWDAVEDAASYNVYRYYSATKTELLANVDVTSYVMTGLRPGVNIYFVVEAVTLDGTHISAPSSVVNAVAESIPAAPQNVSAMPANRPLSVYLTWDAVEDATGYEVYRYIGSDTGYVSMGTTDKTDFEAVGLKGGAQSKFCIVALKEEEDFVHKSVMSSSVSAAPNKLAAPTNVTAAATEAREVTLSWSDVPFADRYDVYLYDTVNKAYTVVASSKSTVCKLTSLTPDTTATFRVTAVGEFDTYDISSDFSLSVNCRVLSGPPAVQQLSAAQMSGGKVNLNWSAVSGAVRYNIYCVSAEEGVEDELIGSSLSRNYTIENLTPGRMYRFYVRAIQVKDNVTVTGEPSSQVIVEIPAEKPYIIGDADGSGSVDIVDATFVQRYSTGIKVPVSEETMMHADVDRDGTVSIVDATFIQRYVTFIFIPYLIDCPAV